MKRMLLVGLVAALLAGCGDPKLDATTEATLQESTKKVAEKLSPEEKKQFAADLMLIALSNVDLRNKSADAMQKDINASLNGKTAAELNTMATGIRIEKDKRQREQALLEIKELQSRVASAKAAKAELLKFTVPKSRILSQAEKYSKIPQPIIELTVQNGTSYPILRAYFKATIASPERAIPWFVDAFHYEIGGGLEPGEGAVWKLLPDKFGKFGKWGNIQAPAGAYLSVEVYRLDGPDGKALFDASGLSESEQARLDALQKQYGAI
ncbi:hypothetical protein HX857_17240 [Pseudomonas gingeri]|uniref:DUF6694 family lipoprotein n=1 Tax=Pseudomonas gingeri TaxID=117681 RepID=UPI0015B8EC05|nr:DUF6694 family lipoprotein [Pseudomonas gingeri]NWE70445.1 hypothetical protein [Pseudomonas gingeri]